MLSSGFGEIWVYKQWMDLSDMKASDVLRMDKNVISTPGLVDFEPLMLQNGPTEEAVIYMFLAQNVKFDFGPDFAMLMTVHFDVERKTYNPAILPENIQVITFSVLCP